MTDPATNPGQHCDHERICYLYLDANVGTKRKRRCKISPCNYDTRSRPLPAAPEGKEGWDFYTPDHVLRIIAIDREKQKSEAAAQARADVLDELCTACRALNEYKGWCAKCVVQSLRQQENTSSTGDEKR